MIRPMSAGWHGMIPVSQLPGRLVIPYLPRKTATIRGLPSFPTSSLPPIQVEMKKDLILVTGGAGFIGSAIVRHLIREQGVRVLNVDKLTYAANLANLTDVCSHPEYFFEQIDTCSHS